MTTTEQEHGDTVSTDSDLLPDDYTASTDTYHALRTGRGTPHNRIDTFMRTAQDHSVAADDVAADIADTLDVHTGTADRWLALQQDAGLLDPFLTPTVKGQHVQTLIDQYVDDIHEPATDPADAFRDALYKTYDTETNLVPDEAIERRFDSMMHHPVMELPHDRCRQQQAYDDLSTVFDSMTEWQQDRAPAFAAYTGQPATVDDAADRYTATTDDAVDTEQVADWTTDWADLGLLEPAGDEQYTMTDRGEQVYQLLQTYQQITAREQERIDRMQELQQARLDAYN